MTAYLYKTDGSRFLISPQKGKVFSLEELQSLVDGYIQLVDYTDKYYLVVNEDGLLKDLPRNPFVFGMQSFVGNVAMIEKSQID